MEYDLYLIDKYLKEAGIIKDLRIMARLTGDIPDHYRVYFAAKEGEIVFGIDNPDAGGILCLKWWSLKATGDTSVFIIKGDHIVDTFTVDSRGLLYAQTQLSGRLLLPPSSQQSILLSKTHWREEAAKIDPEFADASDADILDALYTDRS